jgi:hypothetical protein
MTQTATSTSPDQTYHSDARPDFTPFEVVPGPIPGFAYAGGLAEELRAGTITAQAALDLLDDMLAVRELE